MNIIQTENLKTYFPLTGGLLQRQVGFVRAVDDVGIQVRKGQIAAVVGESGCGKTTLGFSLLGLVPVYSGRIMLNGQDIDVRQPNAWKPFRRRFQIIFQDPYTSLNPRHTIFRILSEPMRVHRVVNKAKLKDAVAESLEQVGLSPDYGDRFPHEFSGGQRQRIAIARAIGIQPQFIVCDEVVSALDVSVQAQIIQLLLKLKQEMTLSLMFIAHDLSLVRTISDYVYVMYLGKIMESGKPADLFTKPKHPYTRALIQSVPTLDKSRRPQVLKGEVPSFLKMPKGCVFASRCPNAQSRCHEKHPDLVTHENGQVACYYPIN